MMLKIFAALILGISFSWAQTETTLIERTLVAESTETNMLVAKKQMQDQAIRDFTESLLKDLIGSERVAKNKDLIESKIIKQWANYIPYLKPSEVTATKDQKLMMSVQMKLSLANLRNLLKTHGLLVDEASEPIFIPFWSVSDRINNQQFLWWTSSDDENTFLRRQARNLEKTFQSSFAKNGLILLTPIQSHFTLQIPPIYKQEKWSQEDWQFLSQYFLCNVIVDGSIQIEKSTVNSKAYSISIRLIANQISNGRWLAEMQRKYETAPGSFEGAVESKLREVVPGLSHELSQQVFDVWERGTIGAKVFKISLKGKLSPRDKEIFKEKLKSNITQIKTIKERLISTDSILFEVDSTTSTKELSEKMSALSFPGYKLKMDKETENELSFEIRGG